MCQGSVGKYSWEQAVGIAENFSYAGYADWRLPTIAELTSLLYCSNGKPKNWNDTNHACDDIYDKPTLKSGVFPGAPASWVWSASPDLNDSSSAWIADFFNGYSYSGFKNQAFAVRLVRTDE